MLERETPGLGRDTGCWEGERNVLIWGLEVLGMVTSGGVEG